VTNATARKELAEAKVAGFCGFCLHRSRPLKHKRTCKLVIEHGQRIGLRPSDIIQE
jgi:hypothetical protein